MSSRPPGGRIRSCAPCHRRKVRCDKGLPCSQCVRSSFECLYPLSSAPVARRRRSTTLNDVASRISQMEKTIGAFKAKAGQVSPQNTVPASPATVANSSPSPASVSAGRVSGKLIAGSKKAKQACGEGLLFNKGTSSHYVNEILLAQVIQQEDDVRSALATPRSKPPQNVNLPPYHLNPISWLSTGIAPVSTAIFYPQRSVAVRLWKVFVDNVDPFCKVTHLRTTETIIYTVISDPTSASNEDLALCFAIYYASISALPTAEIFNITGEDTSQTLLRFRTCLEQSLTQADFLDNPTITLLQALAIYGAAARVYSSGPASWITNGLALRAAQSIGLHKDGSKLGLSLFESEIRRRVWWHFQEREGRGAEDCGLQNTPGGNALYGAELPRNLHDSDIFPEMKELPPSRSEWTRMTLPMCINQSSLAWTQLSQMSCSPDGVPDEAVRHQIIKAAIGKVEGILKRCNLIIPEQKMTARVARLILWKVDVISRRQWQILRSPGDHEQRATESEMNEAIQVLELCNSLWEDDELVAYRWIVRAFPQYHIMLFILRQLCEFPRQELSRRAFTAVDEHLKNFETSGIGSPSGLKWTVLMTLRGRVYSLIQRVDSVEGGLVSVQQDESGQQMVLQGTSEDEMENEEEITLPNWKLILEEFPFDMSLDYRLAY